MKISVFGIGYVGTVLSACLAEDGHEIIAVDVSAEKVRAINAGETPISEPGVPALIDKAVSTKTAARHHRCGRGRARQRAQLRVRRHAQPA